MDTRAIKRLVRQCLIAYGLEYPAPLIRIEESASALLIDVVFESEAALEEADAQGLTEEIRLALIPAIIDQHNADLGRRGVRVYFDYDGEH